MAPNQSRRVVRAPRVTGPTVSFLLTGSAKLDGYHTETLREISQVNDLVVRRIEGHAKRQFSPKWKE